MSFKEFTFFPQGICNKYVTSVFIMLLIIIVLQVQKRIAS